MLGELEHDTVEGTALLERLAHRPFGELIGVHVDRHEAIRRNLPRQPKRASDYRCLQLIGQTLLSGQCEELVGAQRGFDRKARQQFVSRNLAPLQVGDRLGNQRDARGIFEHLPNRRHPGSLQRLTR